MNKQRYDRLAQQKSRSNKRSYVTEVENLQIILAWQAGKISEGVAAREIGVDRLQLRTMRDNATQHGVHLTLGDSAAN